MTAAAYFAATFLAAYLVNRRKIAVGSTVFVVLFVAHAVTPYLALVSFGSRWYLSPYFLLFAVIPATAGLVLAILTHRRGPRVLA
jgi:hypothetical protein